MKIKSGLMSCDVLNLKMLAGVVGCLDLRVDNSTTLIRLETENLSSFSRKTTSKLC